MPIELPGGCQVFGLREGTPHTRREGLSVWRHVGRERGAAAISLSVLELGPGASAFWRNGECDEVLSILEGEGELILAGRRYPLRPATGIYARPGVGIGLENSGPGGLSLLSSRCPDPGPEIDFEESRAETPIDSASSRRALPLSCHSEERSDEESAFVHPRLESPSGQAPRGGISLADESRSLASLGMTTGQRGMSSDSP